MVLAPAGIQAASNTGKLPEPPKFKTSFEIKNKRKPVMIPPPMAKKALVLRLCRSENTAAISTMAPNSNGSAVREYSRSLWFNAENPAASKSRMKRGNSQNEIV